MAHDAKGRHDPVTAKNLAIKSGIRTNPPVFAQRLGLRGRIAHNLDRTVCWPLRQFLTGQLRHLAPFIAMAAVFMAGCQSKPPHSEPASSGTRRGGEIAVSVRAEPRSLNRLVARDTGTALFGHLTQARLVRINQTTQEVEPWLAESWTTSPDGLRTTMKLRDGV